MIFWIRTKKDVIHLLITLDELPTLEDIYIVPIPIREGGKVFFKLNDRVVNAIFQRLNKSHREITLRFIDGILSSSGLQALSQQMCTNTTVVTLDLSHHRHFRNAGFLNDENVFLIAKFLKENTTLTSLNLANGDFHEKACELLSEALMVNKTVRDLDLESRWNESSFLSAKNRPSIAEMLKTNTTLTSLILTSHDISRNEDAQVLADAINMNKTLSHLNLHACFFASDDAIGKASIFITQAFKDNQTLRSLDFFENYFELDTFATMLIRNSGLRKLSLLNMLDVSADKLFRVIEQRQAPLFLVFSLDKAERDEDEYVHETSWDAGVEAINKGSERKMQVIEEDRKSKREAFMEGTHPILGEKSAIMTFVSDPLYDQALLNEIFTMAEIEGEEQETSEEEEHKTLVELSYAMGASQEEDERVVQKLREALQKIDKREALSSSMLTHAWDGKRRAEESELSKARASSSSSASGAARPAKRQRRVHEGV